MLDVRRLALLRELALRGTVAAAAESLHLTGPAVSQQLAILEREAGVPLLERQGRTLALTDAGRLLVTHADVVLADVARAESDLAALRGGTLGTVRIAAFPSAARTLVAGAWPAATGLTLRLREQEPDAALAALARREADVAVVHAYSLLPRALPEVDAAHLLDDPVLLALDPAEAARRGFAAGRPVRLADVADLGWLVPGAGTSCHEMIERACGAAGFVVRPVAEATDFAVLGALVAAGAGVALIPRLALPTARDGIALFRPADPVTRTVTAVTRRGESRRPELARAVDVLRSAAAEHLAEQERMVS
jgi:DNA-binding transcriptional LysR family regulator